MKLTLRNSPVAILCLSLACAAALAQVQPSLGGPVHSRFGHLMSRMNDRPTLAATPAVQSPGSPELTLTFGMVDFPGQMDTAGSAANDKGAIVGQYGASFTGPEQGFELVGKTYTTIVYPGAVDTSAIGINKSGEIVGYWDSGGDGHGFLLSKGTFTSNDVPGAATTSALGINKAAGIVGLYYNSDGSSHGFLLQSGTFTTVDYPGGYSQNYLWGINDQGVMVGAYGEPTTINGVSHAWEHAFIYQNGQFTNADAPFGPPAATQPFGISNNGVIVGEYVDNSGTVYGYEATVAQ